MGLKEELAAKASTSQSVKVELNDLGGGLLEVNNAVFDTATPSEKDWGFIFERFGRDPEHFELVKPPTSESSWDSGDRVMYSFKGVQFRLKPEGRLSELQVEKKLEEMAAWEPPKRKPDRRMKPSVSEVILPSDFQAGSSEGGGVDELTRRWHRALDQLDDKLTKTKREKHLHSVVLANMGDLIEGCFAGETRVLTKGGYRPIGELAREGVAEVRTDYGKWVEAEVKSFGTRRLYALTLDRMGARKVVYTTAGHRWVTKRGNNRIDKLTCELREGDYLASVFGGVGALRPSRFGIAAGMVYGDGHKDGRGGAALMLYENKWELAEYLNDPNPGGPYTDSGGEEPYLKFSRLPEFFKDAPDLSLSPDYLAGWLAGYIATDGSVGKTVSITSASRESLELVENVAALLGIGTNPITEQRAPNGYAGDPNYVAYRITFIRSTCPDWLFLRNKHRERIGAMTPRARKSGYETRSRQWRVVSVEETDRTEEVYCAVVPDTHTFAIEGQILTGNSMGFYPNQKFTVELDLRSQIRYAAEFLLTFSKHFFPMAEEGHFVTALSNHGELGRAGGNKNTTTDHDSADGLLAEMLEMMLRMNRAFDHVRFHTPDDEMITYAEVQGVPLGFLHGHKVKGNDATGFTKWLEQQQRGDSRAWAVEIWHIAHRHNYQHWDIGSASVFQMPSCDGGSKWLRDTTGKFSRPALVSYTLNPEIPMRWENVLLAAQESRMLGT